MRISLYLSQYECSKYDLEEVSEQHFQLKISIFVNNPDAHFTFKSSANQDLKPCIHLVLGLKSSFSSACEVIVSKVIIFMECFIYQIARTFLRYLQAYRPEPS